MTTVTEAQAELDRLQAAKTALQERVAGYAGKIAAAREQAAVQVLDAQLSGGSVDGHAKKLREIEADRDSWLTAIDAAGRRISQAEIELWQAQAIELRERAGALRLTADERPARTAALLAEVEAFEECRFGPLMTTIDMSGTKEVSYSQAATKTERLRAEARRLDLQAWELEAKMSKATLASKAKRG
jgi:hypothetical protein